MAANENQVTEAKTLLSQLNNIDLSDPNAHRDAILKSRTLANTLQDPGDKAMEGLLSFTLFPCLYTANDLGIFQKLSQGPLTAQQLATQTGADVLVIGSADLIYKVRVMRAIASAGIVRETGPESYAPTPVSDVYATPAFGAGLRFSSNFIGSITRLPEYLKETNYRNPTSSVENGPFQYCVGTNLSTFEWLAQHPDIGHQFNLFMTTHRAQQHWSETFPVQAKIFDGVTINKDAPLVVDVAGGFGHDLRILKGKLPSVTKGQLVLEDQASVIDTVPDDLRDANIEYVKHNFFTPQPVKGARVYTLKSIIHDWPDDKALEILRNIASGMTPGYSKIWLLEGIVPETNASQCLAGMDITMMVFLGALERTKRQWFELLEEAGLEVADVATRPDGFGVVEAMLKV